MNAHVARILALTALLATLIYAQQVTITATDIEQARQAIQTGLGIGCGIIRYIVLGLFFIVVIATVVWGLRGVVEGSPLRRIIPAVVFETAAFIGFLFGGALMEAQLFGRNTVGVLCCITPEFLHVVVEATGLQCS